MKETVFTAGDGKKLACVLWATVKNPVGVVQIIHGMDEHMRRYDRFAKFLNKHGYIVFGDDHRAHGRTARSISHIGKPDGSPDLFAETVSDEMEIYTYLRRRFNLPVVLFGHSYGSFITQKLIQTPGFAAAAICLSGSARYPWALAAMGRAMAWIGMKIRGTDAPAKFLEKMSPIRDKSDGTSRLTRDAVQSAAHKSDPMRAKYFSYGFYYSLFKNLMTLGAPSCVCAPMLIISGARDMVSFNARFARHLYRKYQSYGMNNLEIIIYDDALHELLMELNYADVQNDILNFLDTNIGKSQSNKPRQHRRA